jgi:hypothetical protein
MGSRRTSKRGFPSGCQLPDDLADEVLGGTTRWTRRACKVCIDLGSRTENYRKNCEWWKGMHDRFLGSTPIK